MPRHSDRNDAFSGQVDPRTRFKPQPCLRHLAPTLAGSYPTHPGRGGRCAEMARLIGVSPGAMAAYVRGKRCPPPWVREAVAEMLRLPVEQCWTAEVLATPDDGRRSRPPAQRSG